MLNRSICRGRLRRVVIAGLLATTCGSATATVVRSMTDGEIVAEAESILHGTVTAIDSSWNVGHDQIHTLIDIRIHEQLKGRPLGTSLRLRTLGGVVDDIGMEIVGAPSFHVGEGVVLMLGPNRETWFPIVGFNQGFFAVTADVRSGRRHVRRRGVDLQTFLRSVRDLIETPDLTAHIGGVPTPTSGVATPLERFRLSQPDGNNQITAAVIVAPHVSPPFIHWDLREFPGCTIPYSVVDGTADIAGNGEITAIDAAFATWAAVGPAIIAFERVAVPIGAGCPFVFDDSNTIAFNGNNCPMPGDDVWLPGAGENPACGSIVGQNTPIIGRGRDEWLTTFPNAGCPGGDDEYAGGQITAGLNGCIDTLRNGALGSVIGLTAWFYDAGSGDLIEADILLNDLLTWQTVAHGEPMGGSPDVQSILTHEAGHLLGLHHADDNTGLLHNPPGPMMNGLIYLDGGDDVWLIGNAADQQCGANVGKDTPIIGPGDNGLLDTVRNLCPGGGGDDAAVDGNITAGPNGIVESILANSNHQLSTGDTDGINFLYTPDLGDAAELDTTFNHYPSFVHSDNPANKPPPRVGRRLNGRDLFDPASGATHLYGFVGSDTNAPRYQYEWLSPQGFPPGSIDGNNNECEAIVAPGSDMFDDGVTFSDSFDSFGAIVTVTVSVRTRGDEFENAHDYDTTPMYINGWFDFNADGDWDDAGEHAIGGAAGAAAVTAAGATGFEVTAPLGSLPGGWARFRLDYGEDVDQRGDGFDVTLAGPRGAAQFGEVEDYRIPFTCPWDLNGDGFVGIIDLLALLAGWGSDGPADFNGDGAVGIGDLLDFLAHWGACP